MRLSPFTFSRWVSAGALQVALLVFWGAGCGRKNSSEATYSLPARNQCFGIVNGQASMEFPAVVVIMTSSLARCTGTFVGTNTLVTAAHCVENTQNGNSQILLDDCANRRSIMIDAEKIFTAGYHAEDYGNAVSSKHDDLFEKDIAVVLVPDGTAPALMALSPKPVAADDQLVMMGFGSDKPSANVLPGDDKGFEYYTKRKGRAKATADVNSDPTVLVQALASDSYISLGDSGGPLLLNDRLAGVASFTIDAKEAEVLPISGWTNIFSPIVRAVFVEAKKNGARFEGWDEAYGAR